MQPMRPNPRIYPIALLQVGIYWEVDLGTAAPYYE